ncbi:MAG: hypothetical protein M1115_03430 [Actinobacteria bacterium]|nr:hypothetical protein [Actinomycetota bacterium]
MAERVIAAVRVPGIFPSRLEPGLSDRRPGVEKARGGFADLEAEVTVPSLTALQDGAGIWRQEGREPKIFEIL